MPTFFTEVFEDASPVAPLGLIVLKGAEDLGRKIITLSNGITATSVTKIPNSKRNLL